MRKLVVAMILAWLAGPVLSAMAATDDGQSDQRSNGQGEGQCHKKQDTPTS